VVVIKVGDGERVVSVARLPESDEENGNGEAEENGGPDGDDAATGEGQEDQT
jgi:hypothetical protein